MDILLALMMSQDLKEVSVSADWANHYSHWGVEASVLYEPELGAQTRFYLASKDRLFFKVSGGMAYFDENMPARGTKHNFVGAFAVGYTVNDRLTPFVEARHYSNGKTLFEGDRENNPGRDMFLAGLSYKF